MHAYHAYMSVCDIDNFVMLLKALYVVLLFNVALFGDIRRPMEPGIGCDRLLTLVLSF